MNKLRTDKAILADLMDSKKELDKKMYNYHQKIINSKVYIRDLTKKLDEHKKNNVNNNDYKNITENDIKKLEEKIEQMKQERSEKDIENMAELRALEKDKIECLKENQR